MAGSDSEFVSYVVESLQPLGPVGARRMFGGHGIYLHGTMFALIAYDTLYFKVDDGNRSAYEAAGLEAFTYTDKGKPIRMPYHEAPSEGFDDPEVLCAWAREAYAAALRTKKPQRSRIQSARLVDDLTAGQPRRRLSSQDHDVPGLSSRRGNHRRRRH